WPWGRAPSRASRTCRPSVALAEIADAEIEHEAGAALIVDERAARLERAASALDELRCGRASGVAARSGRDAAGVEAGADGAAAGGPGLGAGADHAGAGVGVGVGAETGQGQGGVKYEAGRVDVAALARATELVAGRRRAAARLDDAEVGARRGVAAALGRDR